MGQAVVDTETAAVCALKKERDAAEVALLQGVVAWTAAHRVDREVVDEMTFGENGVLLGGIGCPLVREFDVYDLAARLGMSSDSGCGYVAKILELRYRLPHTWERVVSLAVPVWKAFIVCGHTMNLSWEAAAHIDQMLAPVLHSCSFAQIERTIAMGIDLYDPDEAEQRRLRAADGRSFEVFLGARGATTHGTIHVAGALAFEDALDLEQAVKEGAQTLRDLGSNEPLGARRSITVGDMARNQLTLNLTTDHDDLESGQDMGGRGVTIYAHLDPDSDHASVDNVGAGDVLIAQVKAWCQAAGTVVTIKPVIDLNAQISTGAYTPTDKLAEQVRLRDQCCVFPSCTRRARHCDVDHVIPFDHDHPSAGGPTSTSNLALLCRRHHRTKTFSTWTYTSPQPGVYDWTSPTGARFRVTRNKRHGRLPITTPLNDPPEP